MNPFSSQTLTAILLEGKVWLNYRLGMADGITLLCRRGTEPDFSPIAEDEPAPVVDERPKLDPHRPETRCYRAVLRYSSDECRQLSNEIVMTLP